MISPFIGNMFGPLGVGHVLVIVGKTIDSASRSVGSFEVDIICRSSRTLLFTITILI